MPTSYSSYNPYYSSSPASGSGAYGMVPQVPSPTQTATQALQGNISNLGDLYGLSAGVGAASGAGAMAQYSGSIPGLPGYLSQAGGAVSSELAGQLPADVMAQLQLGGAQRGIGTGTQGSANSNAAYMQMLGLSSLGMQQQGQKDLGQLIGETPAGPAFNPASMLVNPSDQQSAAGYNSVMSAAPNPTMAAQASMNAARAGMGAGGAGFGGGGAPAYQPAPNPYSGGNFGGGIEQPWQQSGYGSQQDYNTALDASIFPWAQDPSAAQQGQGTYGQDIYDPSGSMFGDAGMSGQEFDFNMDSGW